MPFSGLIKGRKQKTSEIETQEPPLGGYLLKHDLPGNEFVRRSMETKILAIVAGIFAMISIIEAITITILLPLYKVVPFFVTFSDKADQVVRIDPPTGRIPGIKILAEQMVRDYIVMRHTVTADETETADRWGTRIRLLSSESVYNSFLIETKPVYEKLSSRSYTRTISVRSVLDMKDGIYQVEFEANDHQQGTGLTDTTDTKSAWVTQMRINSQSRRVSYDQRTINPFGFTVIEYSVAKKK